MQSAHCSQDIKGHYITEENAIHRAKQIGNGKKFNSQINQFPKDPLDQYMQEMIHSLSYELNEAREELRQKAYVLNTQNIDKKTYERSLKRDVKCQKKDFSQLTENAPNIGNSIDNEDEYDVKTKACSKQRKTNKSGSFHNYVKSNENYDENKKKRELGPKFNVDALKKLLVIVNKINKTYDPIRV